MKYAALFAALFLVTAPLYAIWPFNSSNAETKEKQKELKVISMLQEPKRLMNEAQDLEADGKTTEAVDSYKKAIQIMTGIEEKEDTTGSEWASLRFDKAMCETMIDRIIYDKADKNQRTITMSHTRSLEQKLAAERAAATNKTAKAAAPEAATNVPAPAVAAAVKPTPVNAASEISFAKDMLDDELYSEAEKAVMRVLHAYPDHTDALMLLAILRLRQNRPEDALHAIDNVLERFPDDDAAAMIGAAAALSVRNFPRALDLVDDVLERRREDPAAYNNKAWILVEMRNPRNLATAEDYYRQGVQLGGARDRRLEKLLGIDTED